MSFTLSLVYILWSCKKIKKLPRNENRIKPKLKNGYEGEYSMCMKHKMVSEATCNDNEEMLGDKNNKIWRDKCMQTNMIYEARN